MTTSPILDHTPAQYAALIREAQRYMADYNDRLRALLAEGCHPRLAERIARLATPTRRQEGRL